jgi:hypothetical protein
MRGANLSRQLGGVLDAAGPVVDHHEIVSAARHLRESQRILFHRLHLAPEALGIFASRDGLNRPVRILARNPHGT